jgi:hypothetical protein
MISREVGEFLVEKKEDRETPFLQAKEAKQQVKIWIDQMKS